MRNINLKRDSNFFIKRKNIEVN